MRSSVTSTVVLVGLTAGLASIYGGCTVGDDTGGGGNPFTNPTAGSGGGSVVPGAGTSAGGTSSTAGTGITAGTTTGGTAPTAGTTTGGATTGGQSTGGSAGTGTGGGSGGGAITKVWKSDGCGKAFTGTSGAKVTIQTMGTKPDGCADKLGGVPKCGPYTVNRDYYVTMPANYDMNKAYPLVIQGPGCGGNGTNVYTLDNQSTVIGVGLTPPPNSIGHGTNENQGCFDDKEGDDSVDWVFYENFYDKLNAEVCFDRNRVFSAGNSSGSWFSNELGCKYAGDAKRPVRGIMPNTGGLPNEPQFSPTCTKSPMSGMWVHEINDGTNPFTGNKFAIDRALKVNGCTGATSYDAKVAANEYQNFPIGGNNPDNTCQLLKGCPEIYPLVVCPLPGNQHGGHDSVVKPGFATFIKLFSAGNFLTQ